jgi:outer membrane receptor protein involved in Fe transport
LAGKRAWWSRRSTTRAPCASWWAASLYGDELGPNLEELPNGNYLSEERSYALGAAYALLESTPIDWFRLSAGVRVDIYSTFGPIVVPRGALIFKPWEGGVIKLMSGRAFRAPSIYEQYYNDAGFSQAAANDANRGLELGPESTFANELEVSQHFLENWTALASGHASYITGIINTVADTPGSAIIRYANSDSAVLTVGGEAELRREWRQGWMLAGFYGYEHARYLEPSVVPSLQGSPRLANSPRHLAGAKGALPGGRWWRIWRFRAASRATACATRSASTTCSTGATQCPWPRPSPAAPWCSQAAPSWPTCPSRIPRSAWRLATRDA